MKKEILEKISAKKPFSKLPKEDIERVFEKFEKRDSSEKEKIRLAREFLNKLFWPFRSYKLLEIKPEKIPEKKEEWFLRKHLSTRERLGHYEMIYSRILKEGDLVFDLGAGANGFSYKFMPRKVRYFGVEAVGQLADLMNVYFKFKKLDAEYFHLSLFDLKELKKIIKQKIKNSGQRKVLFLFKVMDSLEAVEKNYTKKLLKEISPFFDVIAVSFATKSMLKKERFKANRKWITEFIKKNFKIFDDFEVSGERYVVFGHLNLKKDLRKA